MTDARLTQLPILALAEGAADSQISQLPIMALGEIVTVARMTQLPIMVLADDKSGSIITQLPIMVLCYSVDCVSYLTQCWRIQRRDGVVHTFTSHDQPIEYLGETYLPCGSINASAYQASGQFGEIGNANLVGLMDIDGEQPGIPSYDIAAGLLDAAEVKIWEIAWQGDEPPFPLFKGYIGKIIKKDINYEAEIISLSGLLNNQSLLDSYTPNCRFQLGDSSCTVDLTSFTESSTVSELAEGNARLQSSKRQFFDIARIEADGYWANGLLTWDGGLNTGYSSEVASSFDDGGISLWNSMPYDIEVGDAYTIIAGCDKTKATCISKFNNIENFGGFPDIPGTDVIFQTPDANQ